MFNAEFVGENFVNGKDTSKKVVVSIVSQSRVASSLRTFNTTTTCRRHSDSKNLFTADEPN